MSSFRISSQSVTSGGSGAYTSYAGLKLRSSAVCAESFPGQEGTERPTIPGRLRSGMRLEWFPSPPHIFPGARHGLEEGWRGDASGYLLWCCRGADAFPRLWRGASDQQPQSGAESVNFAGPAAFVSVATVRMKARLGVGYPGGVRGELNQTTQRHLEAGAIRPASAGGHRRGSARGPGRKRRRG
ncbi:hypothetical protein SKAU_G00335030 [Synaphobranchus kaupii]|uniref:Uncharacterized protein n=1 Tax=Synaphobranchus kaupii TaxID=118154 RepID=A0A9Q1EM17_SYNKA|nr:hypothetical protein SKAU_G00335030 [Synaphobranchus kaupii]